MCFILNLQLYSAIFSFLEIYKKKNSKIYYHFCLLTHYERKKYTTVLNIKIAKISQNNLSICVHKMDRSKSKKNRFDIILNDENCSSFGF